jgi:hypothetical protein
MSVTAPIISAYEGSCRIGRTRGRHREHIAVECLIGNRDQRTPRGWRLA